MKIPDVLQKYTDVIENYINSPMFFVYDNELINLYDRLSRMTADELTLFCQDSKYAEMCGIVQDERSGKTIEGNSLVAPFVNSKGMISAEGLLPILASFPDFNSAMNFIMSVKPGFRYTQKFKKFVEDNTVIEETTNVNGDPIKRYSLGKYSYEIHDSDNYLDISYYKDGKLHRINGPAIISMVNDNLGAGFTLEWYINGKEDRNGNEPAYMKYYFNRRINFVEETYKWYSVGKLNRDDGPAIVRILKPVSELSIRNSETLLTVTRTSDEGIAELKRRNINPKHRIISGQGDSIVEDYYKNGKQIYV